MATMLYDLANSPPEPGSLLESVLLLMAKKKREAEFFQAKLMVEAMLAPHAESTDGLLKAYESYREAMFPFLGSELNKEKVEAKKLLDHWVGKKAFSVKPIWQVGNNKGFASKLRRGAARVKEKEAEKRRQKRVRIG